MASGFILRGDLLARLDAARRVFVLTGAGMSAESGIPTFREAQIGLWARYDPRELAKEARLLVAQKIGLRVHEST